MKQRRRSQEKRLKNRENDDEVDEVESKQMERRDDVISERNGKEIVEQEVSDSGWRRGCFSVLLSDRGDCVLESLA